MVIPITLTIILTFLTPFINAWVQNVNWSPKTKNLVAILTSAIVAVAFLLMTGGIADWSQLGIVVPAVYGLQQAIYNFFLKNVATKFEAITSKTPEVDTAAPAPVESPVEITKDPDVQG